MEVQRCEDRASDMARQVDEEHTSELATVDEKVRGVMTRKDDHIAALENRVRVLQRDLYEVKSSLAEVL
jgi:hypothetical protein